MPIISIYYPGSNKGSTQAFDYQIEPGGLAFHSADRRLDRLVQEKFLRKVETDKIDLPNGIQMLNIPYHCWEDANFDPAVAVMRPSDVYDGPIAVPPGFKSPVPQPIVESLKAMRSDIDPNAPSPGFVPVPARPVPTSGATSVDPTTGATIMPATTPEPNLYSEIDPEWLQEQEQNTIVNLDESAGTNSNVYTVAQLDEMNIDEVLDLAKNQGFRGSSRQRAMSFLATKGLVEVTKPND